MLNIFLFNAIFLFFWATIEAGNEKKYIVSFRTAY